MKIPASFKQALALHFLAVTIFPVLFIGIVSYQYFTQKHLESIADLLNAHAEDVSSEAVEFLRDTSSILNMVAKMIDEGQLHGAEKISQHLQIALEESASFESILVVDQDKKVIFLGLSETNASHFDDYIGLDMSSHNVFTKNNDSQSMSVWSDTFLSTITVEPSITLSIPITRGHLLGTVSIKRLTAALKERLGRVSHDFNFSLLDHHGVVIADTNPVNISQRLNLRLHPEVRNALDYQKEASGKYHEDKSLLESVRLVPETGWVAYASLPVDKALSEIRPLYYLLGIVLGVVAVFGAILSYWMSRQILRPIVALRDAATEVATGKYEQILPAVRYEELNALRSSFLDMLGAIKDREQSLTLSQERYRDLVNSIDGIVWDLDLENFRFTFVSDQSERILGYPAKRWVEEETFWQDHVHPDDRDWALSYCMMETKAQRDHNFEYRMIANNGQSVWLKDIVSVIVEDGRPVRLSGLMLDITKRKEAELELLETAELMQLLIDRMPFGCIMWDEDHKVKMWNPAAEIIFGFSFDEVKGKHPYEFIVPEHVWEHTDGIYERLEAGDLLAHSINENITSDGRIITCEWHNTPLQNPDGSSAGVISMVDDITDRAMAENAVKESEERFRTVFDINPDGVLISSAEDGRIISVNEYILRVTGFTSEEMLGKTALELGLWSDEERRDVYINTVKEQGFVENFEMEVRLKNGRTRIGLISARTLTLNNELCILNVIRDITEIKEAERRMSRSESRFRSLVSVMGEGILILGFNGEIVQCNTAAERILKRSADQLIGMMHGELDHDAIGEDGTPFSEWNHPAEITLKTGKPVINQIMGFPQDDDETIWVQVNAHALGLDKHGKPVAVVVSFADVTRLKITENELREREKNLQSLSRQFQGVLEAIPDRILILDRDMRVVWLNWPEDSLEPDKDLESQDMRCFKLPGVDCGPTANMGSPLCDNCPVRKSFATGRTEVVQRELKDGRTLSLRTFPIFNELGEVVNVIEIAQDITESLQQQAQTMRTAQLASLGELAAGVAHEINNPINGVINYAQLILNKALADSREQELSKRIIKESERIATIVRELLYFSREESAEVTEMTVNEALDEALALTSHQMNKEGITLVIDIADSLPGIASHSHQIPRLFLNLISNARYALNSKYPEGDPNKILQISALVVAKDALKNIRIVFRDHGIGIPQDMLDKVLNPFVTTKPSSEGTGLGLSISHEIIQKHKGTIAIDSVEGEYTEVTIELPALI